MSIEYMAYGIRANATDLAEIWLYQPQCRVEFGEREIADLREAVLKLELLLSAIDLVHRARTPALRIVGQAAAE